MIEKDITDRCRNIKCYDKIKISHSNTGFHLHSVGFELKSGSFNQAVTTHKVHDQSDWFIALLADLPLNNPSYHFQYGDKILLTNCKTKKYLHTSLDFESPVTKNYEVSLCQRGNGGIACLEDEWIVELGEKGEDEYWRVGESIKLKNVHSNSYLGSSRKRMKENSQYEVYVEKEDTLEGNEKKQQISSDKIKQEYQTWVISEIQPYIYTANITSKKQPKKIAQVEELEKLAKMKNALPQKKKKKQTNDFNQILRIQNQRMEQIENQRKKREQYEKKNVWWKKYICCICIKNDEYQKID